MALLSSSAFGAACLSSTSVAALQLLGANGCDVILANETVTFSNFGATGSAVNAAAVLDMNGGAGLAGFTFTDPGTNFGTPFTIMYSAVIKSASCSVGFNCALTGVFEQSAIAPQNSTGSITLSESAGSPATLTVGNQTDNLGGSINVQSLTKTATYNGNPTLISFESAIFASATPIASAPEPVSVALVGSGLLGLVLLRRKIKTTRLT
jgi:hypothetical protein